ncbi:MAG: hypothetical protein Q8O16_07650 [Dehalococcoidia bacterium]|nr:hypothetical protein [Dehalococcoidia bacterium]
MYLVYMAFAAIIVLVALWGYFYSKRISGKKLAYWPLFASGWAVMAIVYAMIGSGLATEMWSVACLRILAYILNIIALVSLAIETRPPRK